MNRRFFLYRKESATEEFKEEFEELARHLPFYRIYKQDGNYNKLESFPVKTTLVYIDKVPVFMIPTHGNFDEVKELKIDKESEVFCPTSVYPEVMAALKRHNINKEITIMDIRVLFQPHYTPFVANHFRFMSHSFYSKFMFINPKPDDPDNEFRDFFPKIDRYLKKAREYQRQVVRALMDSCESVDSYDELMRRDVNSGNWDSMINRGRQDVRTANRVLCLNSDLIAIPDVLDKKLLESYERLVEVASTDTSGAYRSVLDPTQFIYKTTYAYNLSENERSELQSELFHEFFVGVAGTNRLRAEIPNFSFVYGLKNYYISRNYKTKQWKLTKSDYTLPVLIYERINGISLDDFIEEQKKYNQAGIKNCFEVLTLTILATALANERMGFVHSDLHTKNVLVVKLDKPEFIEYKFKHYTIRTMSKFRPVIIDYGFSTIVHEGKTITPRGHYYGHRLSEHPLKDIFKLGVFACKTWPALNPFLSGFNGLDEGDVTRYFARYEVPPREISGIELYEKDHKLKNALNMFGLLPNYELYRYINPVDYLSLLRARFGKLMTLQMEVTYH